MGAGEADGGKRGWSGQARPMGAVSRLAKSRANMRNQVNYSLVFPSSGYASESPLVRNVPSMAKVINKLLKTKRNVIFLEKSSVLGSSSLKQA